MVMPLMRLKLLALVPPHRVCSFASALVCPTLTCSTHMAASFRNAAIAPASSLARKAA